MTNDPLSLQEHIASLYEEALKLAPDRRARFLEAACADNGGLRRRVEALLAAAW